MKKRSQTIRSFCIVAMCLTLLLPTNAGAWSAQYKDEFYEDLALLLGRQDNSFYFDSMELSIGSDILTIDGTVQQMDVTPDIQNNRTMLPIRAIAEAVGATVEYDAENNTAIIVGPYGEEINCPIGSDTMTVNSCFYQLDSPSYAKNGRTYLPVRAVSEALGLEVEWTQETSTVTISAPYQTARVLVWADALNTQGLNANTVLYDGNMLWVLQFDTPAEAGAAVETLNSKGILAEPDYYIPPIEEENMGYTYSVRNSYSWGVEDCSFDVFVEEHGDQFTGHGIVAVIDTGVDASHAFLRGESSRAVILLMEIMMPRTNTIMVPMLPEPSLIV